MIRIEHNATTGEIVEITLTDEEVAQKLKQAAEIEAQKQAFETAKAEVAAAKGLLLAKLGITEEEARLLLSSD